MADPFSSWMESPIKLEDRMRGFTYLSKIYDAQKWTPDRADPLQKANVPLLKRPTPSVSVLNQKLDNAPQNMPLSNILLCTDYGLYHPYETCQSTTITEEQYYVQFWQHVDTFVYFGHQRLAIPPPSWVNAGHRNGVQVLGLLINEGTDDVDADTMALLDRDSNNNYWLADKLGQMAKCYGFDGWFINIEAIVDQTKGTWNNGQSMKDFLTQLRNALAKYGVPDGGKVVWYDSIVNSGVKAFQNTLNAANVDFAQAAGSIFTNYWWSGDDIIKTAGNFAIDHGMTRDQVYSGVNIFKSMQNPAIDSMAKYGVGTGLFATGWCFQQFSAGNANQDTKLFRSDADSYMWTAQPDLSLLKSANPTFDDGRTVDNYIDKNQAAKCITNFARKYPAGSEAFFHTDYGKAVAYLGPRNYQAHLGEQSIWPINRSTDLKNPAGGHLTAKLNDVRATCTIGVALASGVNPTANDQAEGMIILHELNMSSDIDYNLTVKYKRLAQFTDLKVKAFVTVGSNSVEVELVGATDQPATTQPLALTHSSSQIKAVGIHLQGPAKLFSSQGIDVMDIYEITIKPSQESYPTCKIGAVNFKQDGPNSAPFHRLNWSVPIADAASQPKHLPYSSLTGPFSHFNVSIGGTDLGRAHTTSFVLDPETAGNKSGNIDVTIAGVAFDGSLFDTFKGSVAWA